MKTTKPSTLDVRLSTAGLLLALLLVCKPGNVAAQAKDAGAPATATAGAIRYEATRPGTGSKVTVEGTSTFHDWKVDTQFVTGFMEVDPEFDKDLKTPKNTRAEVIIPVRALKSTKSAMDNVMYEAMGADQHKRIEYKVLELTPKSGASFDAKGALTVHGVSKTNTMPVTIERVDAGKLKINGATTVKMTDFGIKPPAPALALGAIKTGDEVKISFDWIVEKKAAQAAK